MQELVTVEIWLNSQLDRIIRSIVFIPYSVGYLMSWADVLVTFSHQFLAGPVQLVSFWLLVSLPLVYLPILLHGLKNNLFPVFFGLLVLHGLTLFLGHGHGHGHGHQGQEA